MNEKTITKIIIEDEALSGVRITVSFYDGYRYYGSTYLHSQEFSVEDKRKIIRTEDLVKEKE